MSQPIPTPRIKELLGWRPNRIDLIRFGISLLLAVLLWGWVTQLQDPFDSSTIAGNTVQIGELPANLQVITALPDARVTIEGSRSEVEAIRQANIQVTAQTSGISAAGTYQVPLVVGDIDVSRVSVEPDEVTIQVEDRISRVLPLKVEKTEATGDLVTNSSVVPRVSQVTVVGPSSAINRVREITLPVAIDESALSYDVSISPIAIDNAGQVINEVEILPETVLVHVEVERRGKSISVIPIVSGVPAEGYTVLQRRALPDAIVVDGPPELLADLLFVNTEAVDVSDATESISVMVEIADLPEGVTMIEPTSGNVEVRVAIENATTSSQLIADIPVETLGIEPGLIATVEPATISIDVSAPEDVLRSMVPADIIVHVNLTGLESGIYVLVPEVSLPSGATWSPTAGDDFRIRVTIESSEAASTPIANPSPPGSPAPSPPA